MAWFSVNLSYSDNNELRAATRPLHREYLAQLLADGKLVLGGRFGDDHGAILVYEAEDKAAAEAILAQDPFTTTPGIVTGYEINEWMVGFNKYE
jgi:uncharacterized protein YciI